MASPLEPAVRALAAGRVVVYPTDTLYGLGVDARDRRAVERLVEVKRRPTGQPISVAVSSVEEIEPLAVMSPMARACVRDLLPGPYTALFTASDKARRTLAPEILGPGMSIGVRVPDHPLARELARRAGVLTATSANRHGERPVRSLAGARRVFGAEVAAYVHGGPAPSGHPSHIVDLRRPHPHTMRRS